MPTETSLATLRLNFSVLNMVIPVVDPYHMTRASEIHRTVILISVDRYMLYHKYWFMYISDILKLSRQNWWRILFWNRLFIFLFSTCLFKTRCCCTIECQAVQTHMNRWRFLKIFLRPSMVICYAINFYYYCKNKYSELMSFIN